MDNQFILELLSGLIVLFLILPFHEFAHAFTAYKLGDPTAREQGRLTINPLAHLDLIGGICLVLCGFGWAKPVPVNPYRFTAMTSEYVETRSGKQRLKRRGISMRAGMAITAGAGPLANLVAAFVAVLIMRIVNAVAMNRIYYDGLLVSESSAEKLMYLIYVVYYIAIININLAIFNLIPIPPLDGSKILGYFGGRKFESWLYSHERELSFGFLIVILICNFSDTIGSIVFFPISWLSGVIYDFLCLITNWIPNLIIG